jgi:hypothetical protein
MSDQQVDLSSRVATSGGAAGKHPFREVHAGLVGPSFGGEFNVIELDFAPEACVRFDDVRFEFDSSFIGPEAKKELRLLGQLHNEDPTRPASIFGHADPTGDDFYNKQLSGRRSQAMYGLLTRRADLWEELFKNPQGGDSWGIRSLQIMLTELGDFSGSPNGVLDAATRAAVSAFQQSPEGAGLVVDGDPGPKTREKLYLAYMDSICVDENGEPFTLDATAGFLARGSDPGGKGDFQGCSEFNPDMVFSEPEHQKFQDPKLKVERDLENTINRRVVVYLFRSGSEVRPDAWPCPRAKEGVAQCRTRFHADGDFRRTPRGENRRTFDTDGNTFACNFYDRLSALSPCEKPPEIVSLCCKRRGVVVSNLDPLGIGRLLVSVPGLPGGGDPLFAMPAVPFAGPAVGFFALPPIGANVWVDFELGNQDLPVWSGCFWGAGEMPAEALAPPGSLVFKTDRVTLVMSSAVGVSGFTLSAAGAGDLSLGVAGAALSNAQGASITGVGPTISINQGAAEVS